MDLFIKKLQSEKNVNIIRKSVVAKKINKNQKFTIYNITTKRPGGGIPASNFFKLIGKKSNRNYLPNELIKNEKKLLYLQLDVLIFIYCLY